MKSLFVVGTMALGAAAMMPAAANAADNPILWQTNSLTYLYGDDFDINPARQQTLTIEHASEWSVGDLFFFTDFTDYISERDESNGGDSYYGEFSPRLSFSKITGKHVGAGFITDTLIAGTYEFGEGNVNTLLLGPGFDLDIPHFDYFQLNFYRRMPRGRKDGNTTQITPTWAVTIPVGNSDILIDGFIDWVIDNDDSYHANFHFNPQVKYDLGKALGYKGQRLYVGIEYSYWKNKYGVKDTPAFDTDESVTSLLIKAHF